MVSPCRFVRYKRKLAQVKKYNFTLEQKKPGKSFRSLRGKKRFSETLRPTQEAWKHAEGRRLGRRRRYVRITPLLGGGLGRQGSSGSESWAKTESSPEEQVLLES